MRAQIQQIMELGFTEAKATEIEDVIDSEWLLDWSECTMREFKAAVRVANEFIANGKSWE